MVDNARIHFSTIDITELERIFWWTFIFQTVSVMNFHHFLSFFFLGNDIKDFLLNCAKNHFNPCLLLTPVSLPHPPWNAESNLKWIFDFEYVPCEADLPEDVKFQYSKTGKSEDFKRDQENLDDYLQSLNHAHWQVTLGLSCETSWNALLSEMTPLIKNCIAMSACYLTCYFIILFLIKN